MTAAIWAHEQNPATGLLYSILIDGFDVAGMVDFSSVRVTEAAPGAVSSMAFTITDPNKLVTIQDYAFVQSWDYTRDLTVFTGWVETQSPSPAYGGSGRNVDVTCYGIEALLDQIIIPNRTIRATDDSGSGFHEFQLIQLLGAYAPLRTARGSGATYTSDLTSPIQDQGDNYYLGPAVAIDGMTIRAAFETLLAAASSSTGIHVSVAFTVDFLRNVRGFWWGVGVAQATYPSDYTTLTIVETPTGTGAASLRWTCDTAAGSVITAVYVKGGNAASTGWVVGDTTKGRAEAYIADSSFLFDFEMADAAGAILGRKGTGSGRGVLTLENFTPINAHPGGKLTITNAALGWSAKSFVISQIDKTFNKTGSQNWTVTFFDVDDAPAAGAPSLSRYMRFLTRTLS